MTYLCRWRYERVSSDARSITDGGSKGGMVGGDAVGTFCCGARNVKSSIGVRPSWYMRSEAVRRVA